MIQCDDRATWPVVRMYQAGSSDPSTAPSATTSPRRTPPAISSSANAAGCSTKPRHNASPIGLTPAASRPAALAAIVTQGTLSV